MGRSITQEKTIVVEDLSTKRSRYLGAAFIAVLLTNLFCSVSEKSGTAQAAAIAVEPKSVIEKNISRKLASFDASALDRARALIAKKKSLKGRLESDVVEYLQSHPESLRHDLHEVVRELNAQPKSNDTTKHVRLLPPPGRPGYEELKIYVDHPYRIGDRLMPADNLLQVLQSTIRLAKKEIVMNVYEFDLDDLATELVRAAKRNVLVRVGVDKKPLAHKPLQLALVEKLRAGGVDINEIDSTKINHQKMIAIDWTDPLLARAVFSSGNFTHSCLDPEGDLYALKPKTDRIIERSIPNANHLITMKSWLAANLINHELTKTMAPELRLRGAGYPTSGAYQITGPGVDPQTFEAYPENSFIIAFTPGGANRDVNKNILAYLLSKSTGPVRMAQFAFSSKDVADALLSRAERDIQTTGKFDFQSVGDTPFAMQLWSQFVKMSGLKRVQEGKGKAKKVTYVEDDESPWLKRLGRDQLEAIRKNIRIAPVVYGKTSVSFNGQVYPVEAKVHHKIMSMGNFAVIGTSFNFSEGAEKNNEQILVFNDSKMAEVVRGITAELARRSPRSVFEEAEIRTARAEKRASSSEKAAEAKSDDDNADDVLPSEAVP